MYRHPRAQNLKRAKRIIALVSVVSIFLIGVSVSRPGSSASCYLFPASKSCTWQEKPEIIPARELTDDETASQVVITEILKKPVMHSNNPKIAFILKIRRPFSLCIYKKVKKKGHDDRFTVYVHASRETAAHVSRFFIGRDIHSEKVEWGKISMVAAEKRLLARALLDPDNQQFVLLSESCVPLHTFDYVYNYLMFTNVSYIECFEDLGPDGSGRYSEHMMPEVDKQDFRKGSQWFSMKRQHAVIVMSDFLYYTKFRLFCKPNMDGRNCYADEHYLPTLFNMIDPKGISKWSLTHVDWSERKWHPKAYRSSDITYDLLKEITTTDEALHLTSDAKRVRSTPCMWNGVRRPCYLFARKFYPDTLDKLMFLLSNYSTI
ncbi:hypothetical protein MANES_03G002800v8 [Manihot esculenta]|uniref:Uncharacterized protein n=1 Tax=Manihot esculenta TaxID=3983 RepID=A0ACB7HY87_MANES|nr:hypothetical protein MANES_03G002800v8 [Manihot esculenta]